VKTPAAHKRLIGPLKKLSLSACVASFLMLTGCAQAPKSEPVYIASRPKLEPLPPELSQIDWQKWTPVCQRAESWLSNSKTLLENVNGF